MHSHRPIDNFVCLFTIDDNSLDSILNNEGSSFDLFSVAFRQYKYILVNAGLISCSRSTYNTIVIVTTSINSSIM